MFSCVEKYTLQNAHSAVDTKYAESVMFNGRIFYCGGQIGQGPDTSYFDTCHSLGLVGDNINSWRKEPTMATTRSEFGMVTQGEKIYAIGGRKDWDNKHSSVESFHPSSNWTLEFEQIGMFVIFFL